MTLKVQILGHRGREAKKLKAAGLKLSWNEPLDAEELAKIGVKHFENF